MAEDDNGDVAKITLAQQIFGRAAGIAARKPPPLPKTDDPPGPKQEAKSSDAKSSEVKSSDSESSDSRGHLVAVHDSSGDDISPAVAARPTPLEPGAAQPKEIKTAAELAKMIELDLARHPDCPSDGFRVTVYGGSHWRAMLTIAPAAGGIRNPGQWRELTDELAERLRTRYDLARE